jgi:hypothetical protein
MHIKGATTTLNRKDAMKVPNFGEKTIITNYGDVVELRITPTGASSPK